MDVARSTVKMSAAAADVLRGYSAYRTERGLRVIA